jgi:ADP-heptose:LPS heptosyltransferase
LLLQAGQLIAQLLLAAVEQLRFALRQARRLGRGIGRNRQRAAFDFGGQALHAHQQREPVRLGFARIRGEAGIVQAQQRRTGFHHLALVHEQLGHDATFEVLDLLHARRRNGLAVAAGHLVHLREMRPEQAERHEGEHAPEREAHDARCVFGQGLAYFRQRLAARAALALQVGRNAPEEAAEMLFS